MGLSLKITTLTYNKEKLIVVNSTNSGVFISGPDFFKVEYSNIKTNEREILEATKEKDNTICISLSYNKSSSKKSSYKYTKTNLCPDDAVAFGNWLLNYAKSLGEKEESSEEN